MTQKRALVTGASGGIGRSLAVALAKEGYVLTVVARNAKLLDEVMTGLEGQGHTALAADLSDPMAQARVAAELKRVPYDLLINNAGSGLYGDFYKAPLPKVQEIMRLNMDALVTLSHAFLTSARNGDALINVASTLAFMPMPFAGVYSATKAFVESFTDSLWFEQRSRGVYVMCLCPGITTTNFHKAAGGTDATTPPAKMAQTPDQVAVVALRALKKRSEPVVISGAMNALMTGVFRKLPRKTTIKVMGKMTKLEL